MTEMIQRLHFEMFTFKIPHRNNTLDPNTVSKVISFLFGLYRITARRTAITAEGNVLYWVKIVEQTNVKNNKCNNTVNESLLTI